MSSLLCYKESSILCLCHPQHNQIAANRTDVTFAWLAIMLGGWVEQEQDNLINDTAQADRIAELLRWCDSNLPKGSYFKDWTPVEHPQLGKVEVVRR